MEKDFETHLVSLLMDDSTRRAVIQAHSETKKQYEHELTIHQVICRYRDTELSDNLKRASAQLYYGRDDLDFETWLAWNTYRLERLDGWVKESDERIQGHYYAIQHLKRQMKPFTGKNIQELELHQGELF